MESRRARLTAAIVLLCTCVPMLSREGLAREGSRESRRDPVAEAIQRAAQDYRQGRHDAAATQLEHAARLIREARSAALSAFLPPPPPGWFAAPRNAEAVGAASAGSASSASREYLQGERLASVRLLADAPAVQAALQVLGTPAFAGVDGARPLRIAGQPGMLKFDSVRRTGRITLVVGQRVLVTVDGVDVSADTLMALAEAMDLAGLARLPP